MNKKNRQNYQAIKLDSTNAKYHYEKRNLYEHFAGDHSSALLSVK